MTPSSLNALVGVILVAFVLCVVALFTLVVRHISKSFQSTESAHKSASLQASFLWIILGGLALTAGWLTLQLALGNVMVVPISH